MLDRFHQIAEQAAESVSRRQFLSRLGRGAIIAATAVGGLLSAPDAAQAAPRACGVGSAGYCLGKKQGSSCRAGRYYGTCVGAPLCYCRLKNRR